MKEKEFLNEFGDLKRCRYCEHFDPMVDDKGKVCSCDKLTHKYFSSKVCKEFKLSDDFEYLLSNL